MNGRKKDLGEIDESIKEALPHVLVGPDGSLTKDVSLKVCWTDGMTLTS
jgi:hypothetical protein